MAIALVYLGCAKLGFSFAFEVRQVTAVWPPSGLALAVFIVFGRTIWPGVFAGAFFCNVISGVPLVPALAIAVGNTVAPSVAALVLTRRFNLSPGLSRLSDVLNLAVVGSVAMMLSATNGALQLLVAGLVGSTSFWSVWTLWWVGDSMGVILFAPLVLTWTMIPHDTADAHRRAELFCCILGVVCVSYLCFTSVFPLAYPVFPLVAWTALRFKQRHIALALVLASAVALWQTTHGQGPFVSGAPDYQIGMLVTFMAVLSITALALGAMASERAAATTALKLNNEALERRVSERTTELALANADLRQSEERFRGAFETSAHGMAIVATDGRWLRVNNAICEIVGYSEFELLATDFQSITHSDDLELDVAHVQRLVSGTADSYQMEKRYLHKSGNVIWILLSVSVVRSESGLPLHFVSHMYGINQIGS